MILKNCGKIKYINILFFLFYTIPLVILALYNHPILWDDYNVLNGINNNFVFKYSNRYSTQINFFLLYPKNIINDKSLFFSVLNIYHLNSLFLIIYFFTSLFLLVYEFSYNFLKVTKDSIYFIYSIFSFLLLNFITHVPEFFYCHTVTNGYTLGSIFMILFLALLIHYKYGSTKKIVTKLILIVITFILSGYIEFFVLFTGFTSFFFFLFVKNDKNKRDIFYFYIFILSILIFLSFFVANKINNSNSIAPKYASTDYNLLRMIPKWLKITINDFFIINFNRFFSLKNIIPTFIIYLILKNELSIKLNFCLKQYFLCFSLYFVIILMSFIGCYSGLNYFTIYSYPRNVFDIIFYFITFIIIISLFNLLSNYIVFKFSNTSSKYPIIILCLLFFLSLLSTKSPIRSMWKNILFCEAYNFNKTLIEDYKILENDDSKIVYLKYPGNPSALFTQQGSYIQFDAEKNIYYATDEFCRFWNKDEMYFK
ncbi:MAG: hypothetical protein MJ176_00660 [Treponema sp.]|nr:hypothetical protein [Treponema sp.]